MSTYDAVVVGARCAGAITAGLLARHGWSVLLVDKAHFPSDTVSTHIMFPNTIARLESLGILERLSSRHDIPSLRFHWRIIGNDLSGTFTPIDGHTTATCVRRLALDDVFVTWALDEGAETRFDAPLTGLVGSGSEDDPVRGAVLNGGEEVKARWVLGADGRASGVAGALGLEKKKPLEGEQAFLFAYFRGLPERDAVSLEVVQERGFMWSPCEDGITLLSVAGRPEITRGSHAERERAFEAGVRGFETSPTDEDLENADRISDLVVVPETMMRGFFRQAHGPGWALVGDAGHFKHPATAQGISDAVEQAVHLADSLTGADPDLEGLAAWRRERSTEHYEWSYLYGSWPNPDLAPAYLRGLASDPAAVQDWLDVFTRRHRPSVVDTPERLNAWFSN
jgi:2-polyprenyl-6-methoxyphenol hydroxylase-like FAD-dependent oxidoreductase